CSIIVPSWSDGAGGGDFHRELAKILGSGNAPADLLCFACAGNTAQRHWSGRFHANANGFHEWQPGQHLNTVTPWGGQRVSVELYGQRGTQYELCVRDASTHVEVGRAKSNGHFLSDFRLGALNDKSIDKSAGGNGGSTVVRFLPHPFASYEVT